MSGRVVPMRPAFELPRVVARGELVIGKQTVIVARIDDCNGLVFLGKLPVAGLLGDPSDEPYKLAAFDVVDVDGSAVRAFEFGETVHQLIFQAGRHQGFRSDFDRRGSQESRSFIEGIVRAAITGAIR